MNAITKLSEIKTIPASITFDFDGLRAVVVAHLERYSNIVLTDDTYKHGKELIKEINLTRKALETARKDEAKKAAEPIKLFEANIKELVSLHDSLLDSLRVQISRFEERQLAEIESLLTSALLKARNDKGVRDGFDQSSIKSLVLLGSRTATGKLTAKALAEVDQMVGEELLLQQQTDLRIAQLEASCFKAGLAAPLTQQHIQHFLFAPEVEYQTKLNALMLSEMEREERAVEYRLMQQQREKGRELDRDKLEENTNNAGHVCDKNAETVEAGTKSADKPAQNESSDFVITCTFIVNVPDHVKEEAIADQFKQKIKSAGFTTLNSLRVDRQPF